MRELIIVVTALLLVGSVAFAKEYEVSKKAGEYTVEVKIDKNPPVVGDNNVKIEIKDSANKHVTDAKVRVDYSMPAMPGGRPVVSLASKPTRRAPSCWSSTATVC